MPQSVRIGTFLFSIRVYEQADEMQSERPAGGGEQCSLAHAKQTDAAFNLSCYNFGGGGGKEIIAS